MILADKDNGHLILYTGMKVPGEAWLQFKFEQKNHESFLVQTATFRPKGLLGRLYWYALPFLFLYFSENGKGFSWRTIR